MHWYTKIIFILTFPLIVLLFVALAAEEILRMAFKDD